jgi:hypothetical protein
VAGGARWRQTISPIVAACFSNSATILNQGRHFAVGVDDEGLRGFHLRLADVGVLQLTADGDFSLLESGQRLLGGAGSLLGAGRNLLGAALQLLGGRGGLVDACCCFARVRAFLRRASASRVAEINELDELDALTVPAAATGTADNDFLTSAVFLSFL